MLVALNYRAGHILVSQGGTALEAGDRSLVVAEDEHPATARKVLTGMDTDDGA